MEAEDAVFRVNWEMFGGNRKRSAFCGSGGPYARFLFCV